MNERTLDIINLARAYLGVVVILIIAMSGAFAMSLESSGSIKALPDYELRRCTDIVNSGTYRMVEDIYDEDLESCFDIQASNVIIDGQGHMIDCYDCDSVISVYGRRNIILKNIDIYADMTGIEYENVIDSTIENLRVDVPDEVALDIWKSTNIKIKDSEIISYELAVWVLQSNGVEISNSRFENSDEGIVIQNSCMSKVYNNTIRDNYDGLTLQNCSGTQVYNNIFKGNQYAFLLQDNANQNWIYNNYVEGNNYVETMGQIGSNFWNLSPMRRLKNIVGGPYMAGNYWTNRNHNGFSDTCQDRDRNGICDNSLTLVQGNVDNYPLAKYNPYVPISIKVI